MDYIGSYKDLLELIEINENILERCRINIKALCTHQIVEGAPAGYPGETSYVDADCIHGHGNKKEMNLDVWKKLIDEISKLESMIYLQEEMLKGLYETKEKIDNKLKGLEGLEYKVAYLKYVEGLNLQQIASKLGYSYQYIREVNAKTYKVPTHKQKIM